MYKAKKEMTPTSIRLLLFKYVTIQQAFKRDGFWQLDFNYMGTNYITPVSGPGWFGVTQIAYGNVTTEFLDDYK